MTDQSDGWREYQKLVLNELQRLDASLEKLTERIETAIKHERGNRMQQEQTVAAELQRITMDVHALKLKASLFGCLFGLLGGLVPVIVATWLRG